MEKKNFPPRKFKNDLDAFEKILVLSDGESHVVGGVLFYGSYDIQVTTLPRHRGCGYMSAIHKNVILASECYDNQQVSIVATELKCMDDFLIRHHMLKMAGLIANNLPEVYGWLRTIHAVDCDEETFIKEFS